MNFTKYLKEPKEVDPIWDELKGGHKGSYEGTSVLISLLCSGSRIEIKFSVRCLRRNRVIGIL